MLSNPSVGEPAADRWAEVSPRHEDHHSKSAGKRRQPAEPEHGLSHQLLKPGVFPSQSSDFARTRLSLRISQHRFLPASRNSLLQR